jgi:4-hydroxybenzoate polyprenyltransferase
MAEQTWFLVLKTPSNHFFLAFVFFSTVTSYSFHWYLTSESIIVSGRLAWIKKHKVYHIVLFFVGVLGSAFFFFYLLPFWPWLLFSTFITFLYSAPKIPYGFFRELRRVAYGKTILLAGVWMYVTTVLPIVISTGKWSLDFTLFTLSRFFLIYAICILFDYRDREDDKAAGIRSMITYFSERGITKLFSLSLVLFALFTLGLLMYGYSPLDVILLLIPGLILALLYNHAKINLSDDLYYFVLDGLMMLSALLMLVFRI